MSNPEKNDTNPQHIVEEHADYLFQFALSKIKNRDLALDFVQDTLVVSLEKISQFEGRSSLRTWMTTILNRKIIDYWRKEKKSNGSISLDSMTQLGSVTMHDHSPKNPEEINLEEEKKNLLELCIDKLPENQRAILIAKYYDEKNGDEIGKEFGITPSNFWVIIHRAKAQLRDCMDKSYLS